MQIAYFFQSKLQNDFDAIFFAFFLKKSVNPLCNNYNSGLA